MGEMHEMYGAWDNGEYNPMDGDIDGPPSQTCFNCDHVFVAEYPRLYCSDLCSDAAELVRYVRACISDGRFRHANIKDAIDIQVAHLLDGGYAWRLRQIAPRLRTQVYERDKGKCQICGESGNEIHHLNGSSDDLTNLQLVCHDCHIEETKSHFIKLSPGDEGYAVKAKAYAALRKRFQARKPLRRCDDHKNWNAEQKLIMAERREEFRWLAE